MIGRIRQSRRRAGRRRLRKLAAATKRLYAGPQPFAPFRIVNALQRAPLETLPHITRMLVPAARRADAAARLRNLIYANGAALLTQEAILTWADPQHRARLPVPRSLARAWRGPVDRPSSLFTFGLFLTARLRAGLRRAFRLARHGAVGHAAPAGSYIVAMGVPAGVAAAADRGGILHWLHSKAPFPTPPAAVSVVSRYLTPGDRQAHPDWVAVCEEPFPRLAGPAARIGFALDAAALSAGTLAAILLGNWQAAVLLADLVETAYYRRIDDAMRPMAAVFFLGSMADRPLWTYAAEADGCATPLIYYASSYSLFSYGGDAVDRDILNPVILENRWNHGWFQTRGAADHLSRLLDEPRTARVVGAFDMADGGAKLPDLPPRALAVFDIEPASQPLRLSAAGYIVPHVLEDAAVAFWRALAALARSLDLVLVHKPKRAADLRRAWRYRRILAELDAEGRYIALPPDTGASRVLQAVPASVIQPFTSVGDVAQALNRPAVYFDAPGTIADAGLHAVGTPVMRGEAELAAWLHGRYGAAAARPESSRSIA